MERKPGAFDHARPLEYWNLPDCFAVLRWRLEGELASAGTREYIRVLRLLERATMRELAAAVTQALATPPQSVRDRPARPRRVPRLDTDRNLTVATRETKSMVLLRHHLKALRLPTIGAECEKVAIRCAADNADHLNYLLQLAELELLERERRAAERRLKAARFPTLKSLDTFD